MPKSTATSGAGAEPKIELVPLWRVVKGEAIADFRVFIDGAYRAFWRANPYRHHWTLHHPYCSNAISRPGARSGTRDQFTCEMDAMAERTRTALAYIPDAAELAAFDPLDATQIEARAYKRQRALRDQFDEPETGAALFDQLAALVDALDRTSTLPPESPELVTARATIRSIRQKEAETILNIEAREKDADFELEWQRKLTVHDARLEAEGSRRAVDAKLDARVDD